MAHDDDNNCTQSKQTPQGLSNVARRLLIPVTSEEVNTNLQFLPASLTNSGKRWQLPQSKTLTKDYSDRRRRWGQIWRRRRRTNRRSQTHIFKSTCFAEAEAMDGWMDLDEAPQRKERWGRTGLLSKQHWCLHYSSTPAQFFRRLKEEVTRTACARGLFGEGGMTN